jgi:hypothetical protein
MFSGSDWILMHGVQQFVKLELHGTKRWKRKEEKKEKRKKESGNPDRLEMVV